MEQLAKRIRELRTDAKLSQEQFGALFSVSQDTVSLWENGKSCPPCEVVVGICRKFGVSADYLLGLSDY